MRTFGNAAVLACLALSLSAGVVVGQQEQEPGGEAERLGTAEEVKAEDAEAAEDSTWMPGSFSGNVAYSTDYSFRGVSQTQRDMAFSGGLDWNHDSGIFLGGWASSVDFGDAYLESDFYGGYAGAFENLSYKVSTTYFYYPDADEFSYWEFGGFLGYDFDVLSVSTGVIGSPDYFGSVGTGWYVPAGFAVPIGTVSCPFGEAFKNCFDLSFDANAGYTHTENNIFTDTHHYWDWNMGLVFAMPFNVKLDFRYVDTDVEDVHDAGARFVFAAKYAF